MQVGQCIDEEHHGLNSCPATTVFLGLTFCRCQPFNCKRITRKHIICPLHTKWPWKWIANPASGQAWVLLWELTTVPELKTRILTFMQGRNLGCCVEQRLFTLDFYTWHTLVVLMNPRFLLSAINGHQIYSLWMAFAHLSNCINWSIACQLNEACMSAEWL